MDSDLIDVPAKDFVVIAEVGCNHRGDFAIAKQFIEVATSFCQVRHIKFQKRTVRELLSEAEYDRPHPEPHHAYGDTYGTHREALEFDIEQHRDLKKYCEDRGATYSASVWDMTALRQILSLEPRSIKIPSAMNTHRDMLEFACRNFPGLIHVSLGMTTRAEESALIKLFQDRGRLQDVVLYACTSAYPIPSSEACLLEIVRLKKAYGSMVRAIGYSGHHNGIGIDVAAYTLGATYIERHFTLNRTWKGTDHAASLEPDGLRRVQKNLASTQAALSYKSSEILPIEEPQRAKLKWKKQVGHAS